MNNRTYGYIRVSDLDQIEDRQMQVMLVAGIDERFIFTDKQSGKDFNSSSTKYLKKLLEKEICWLLNQ